MTDLSKRKTIKNAGLATVAVGSGLFGTLAFAKMQEGQANPGLKLEVKHSKQGTLKVTLQNDSQLPIKLNDISPNRISTPSGDIDLGHLVANKGFSIGPKGKLDLLTSFTPNKHNASHLFLPLSKDIISRNLMVSTATQPHMSAIPVA